MTLPKKKRNRPPRSAYQTCAEAGLTARQTAERLGVAVSTVYHNRQYCTREFVTERRFEREAKDMVYVRACEDGMTTDVLAKIMGVGRPTVLKRAKRLGLKFPDMGEVRRGWPVESEYRLCAEQGLTRRETAVRLGVRRETVRRWGRKLGLVYAGARPRRGRKARRCSADGCAEYSECREGIKAGGGCMCEHDIVVLGQPETALWSRHGGEEGIREYY